MTERRQITSKGAGGQADRLINSIFKLWVVMVSSMSLLIFISMFVTDSWLMPILAFSAAYFFNIYRDRLNSRGGTARCSLLPWVAVRIFLISGLVMVVIDLLYAPWFFGDLISGGFKGVRPIIMSLVVFPVAALICAYTLLMGNRLKPCRRCQKQFGFYPVDGGVASVYFREASFQLRLMLWISLGLGLAGYLYYGLYYVNLNFNPADRYIFEIVPIMVFGLSIIYLYRRYEVMKFQIHAAYGDKPCDSMSTEVRFLVLSGDRLLLAFNQEHISWDTPFSEYLPRTQRLSPSEAKRDFQKLSGEKMPSDEISIKYIYTNEGFANGCNVLHYAVFLPEENADSYIPDNCIWLTLDMIDRLVADRQITKKLANELFRIYAVTMAWKTYDREGHRLYPIRHYRPTFRLRDFSRWDVDYDDVNWLRIYGENEDRRLFRLKRIWNILLGRK